MATQDQPTNLIAFPTTLLARQRQRLSLCGDHAALDRWRDGFRKDGGKLTYDERMSLIVAAAGKRFDFALAGLGEAR